MGERRVSSSIYSVCIRLTARCYNTMERVNVPAAAGSAIVVPMSEARTLVVSQAVKRRKPVASRLLCGDNRTADVIYRSLINVRLHEASRKCQQCSTAEHSRTEARRMVVPLRGERSLRLLVKVSARCYAATVGIGLPPHR